MLLSSNIVASWVGNMNAKQLFEQIGFVLTQGANDQELVYEKQNANPNEGWNFRVVFYLNDQLFSIRDDWGDSYKTDVKVLEAIVYQIKELGWL